MMKSIDAIEKSHFCTLNMAGKQLRREAGILEGTKSVEKRRKEKWAEIWKWGGFRNGK